MTSTRRTFLSSTLAAGSMLALPGQDGAKQAASRKRPLEILILGGTGFLGPSVVRPALAAGHKVTLFNRGKSRKTLFPEVERILGDQDPAKDEGLKNLAKAIEGGRTWDAVVDDIAYYPVWLRPRLELLKKATKHYVLISSISAYAKNDEPGMTEDAELAKVPDENVKDMGKNYELYGGLKAACERLAEQTFPGHCTNVRPGFIVGPEDPTDRFTYWPVRYDQGGEMLWPGSAQDPVQIIDVRDLGNFIVKILENGTYGVFNACGPDEKGWTMGGLLAACKKASKAETKAVWVDADFLAKHGQKGDEGIPIWVPPSGETKGFHRYSNARACKAGLVLRDPVETTRATLEWFKTLPKKRTEDSRDNNLRAGIKAATEQEILAAFAKK